VKAEQEAAESIGTPSNLAFQRRMVKILKRVSSLEAITENHGLTR